MKKIILFFILNSIISFNSYCQSVSNKALDFSNKISNSYDETLSMIQVLQEFNSSGDPLNNYSWNRKLADLYYSQIELVPRNEKVKYWFKYCTQLLLAGDNQKCINEIETILQKQNLSYGNLIDKNNLPLIELLALAYLRLGENNNCQNNHNEYSCILPLENEAQHIEKEGSKKAIEIYSLIYKRFPVDKYKWLLNLAHMTIGEYPLNVPESYFIKYPNWENEKNDFPKFKEIAQNIGLAENGLSGGVSMDDFNNDGFIDIFMTSYGSNDQCKFFTNTGTGYKDSTKEAGLSGLVGGLNTVHADYDNDGFTDIFILRGAWLGKGGKYPNSLLKNMGNGTFKDVSKSSGILSFHPTQTAAWADVNNDGYLDLFIGNESRSNESHSCELYINQKNGKFIEESIKYNLSSINGFVKGVVFGDINNDQLPDLYISIMGGNNLLYKNQNGFFKNISKSAGVEDPNFSFTCWFWDVNNDGFNDIFVSTYDETNLKNLSGDFVKELQGDKVISEKAKLFINNGDETFREESTSYDIDISMYAMGANYGDLDNDGWLDFYIGNGSPEFSSVIPNRMFKNFKGIGFNEVTSAGGFGHIQKGHGVSFADIDNDGDQDIYTVLGGAYEGDEYRNICYENPISKNNWIVIKLKGTHSNSSAIGALIELELDNGRKIYHSINTGGSFGSNSLQAEIGLGKSNSIKNLKVKWPGSKEQAFVNVNVNKKYQITEGQNNLLQIKYSKIDMGVDKKFHHHK
jgi:hypothetical protein